MYKKPNNIEKAKASIQLEKFKNILFQVEMVGKVCGIPVRTLSSWNIKGILPHQKRNEIEKRNTFNLQDIFFIKIISLLREKNISIKDINKLYNWLKVEDRITFAMKEAIKDNLYLITDLQNNYSIISQENFCNSLLKMSDVSVFAFNLRPILYQLTDELRKIKI